MRYKINIFDRGGTYKDTLNIKDVVSSFDFTEQLDGGQGVLNLQVRGQLSDFASGDIIEVQENDPESGAVSPMYTGVIEEVNPIDKKDGVVVNIECLGVFSVLNDIFYYYSGGRDFSRSGTVWTLVKEIIDSFQSDYWALDTDVNNLDGEIIRYTGSSIDDTGDTVNIDFENDTCLSAIKKVIANSGYSFFIWADGVCYLQEPSGFGANLLTLDKDRDDGVVEVNRVLHKRDMVNKYHLKRNWGTEKTYTDATSVSTFGIKELSETRDDILDETTQDIVGAQKLADYAYEREEVTIKINSQKTSSITPGQRVTTQNTRNPINDVQITKIRKGSREWVIYLGDFVTIGKVV